MLNLTGQRCKNTWLPGRLRFYSHLYYMPLYIKIVAFNFVQQWIQFFNCLVMWDSSTIPRPESKALSCLSIDVTVSAMYGVSEFRLSEITSFSCLASNGYTGRYCYFTLICHDMSLAEDNKVLYLFFSKHIDLYFVTSFVLFNFAASIWTIRKYCY